MNATSTRDLVEEVAGGQDSAPHLFSLELNQDQKDIRDWVHGFAADVVRPAAAEGTSARRRPGGDPGGREDRPYGYEGLAQFCFDQSGLGLPLVNEELFWGDAGIGCRSWARRSRSRRSSDRARPSRWASGFSSASAPSTEPQVASFCSSEPDAGSDVSAIRTTAKYDEAKDEWVINGQKAWATIGGIAKVHVVIASVDRELGSRGHAAFIVPA